MEILITGGEVYRELVKKALEDIKATLSCKRIDPEAWTENCKELAETWKANVMLVDSFSDFDIPAPVPVEIEDPPKPRMNQPYGPPKKSTKGKLRKW